MTSSTRRALGTIVIVVALLLTLGAGLTWAVNRAGVIEIDIRSKGAGGTDITGLRIPGPLAEAALVCVPGHLFCELDDEMGEWIPMMRKVCQALADQDDFTLVEVISGREMVRVRKEGNRLVVDVDTPDEQVHVKVPLSLADAVVRKLDGKFL